MIICSSELAAIAKTSEEVKEMVADSPVIAAFTQMIGSKGEQTGTPLLGPSFNMLHP